MKAAVLYKKGDLRLGEWERPVPGAGEIQVHVKACGICGSDIPRILGDEAHFYPIVLGHEFSGVVTAVGEGVKKVSVGDRVACAPLCPCMQCEDCQRGDYSLCKHYSFIGSRRQGGFAEYVVIPEENAIPFAPHVTFEQGALFEPATVALHGVFCGNFQGGTDVAILGAGNIGILAMQWVKILGARRVAVFDVEEARLQLARRLGADEVFSCMDAEMKKGVEAFTNGRGFPFVFETAGQPATIRLGYELVANKGTFTCIGTPHKEAVFAPDIWELLNRKEFRLTGSWMSYSAPFPGREWEMTAHYFETGALRLDDSMIYEKIPLEQCGKIPEIFSEPGRVKGKVLLVNGEEG